MKAFNVYSTTLGIKMGSSSCKIILMTAILTALSMIPTVGKYRIQYDIILLKLAKIDVHYKLLWLPMISTFFWCACSLKPGFL